MGAALRSRVDPIGATSGFELGPALGASSFSLGAWTEQPAFLSSSHFAIFLASRVYARHSPP